MNSAQIRQLQLNLAAAYPHCPSELIETHISWVILAGPYAYKVKKPVRFDFLDFSTLAKRRYYCQRELELNQRLARQYYLQVVPVYQSGAGPTVAAPGSIIDYAVQMKRMDGARQMNRLLEQGQVTPGDMRHLAEVLAGFHRRAGVIREAADIARYERDFADLECVSPHLAQKFGPQAAIALRRSIAAAREFLQGHARHFQQRSQQGHVIDGHGDLHAQNIFLLAAGPVIFDCIEFNDHFRQVDVLDELAFLCMDLDFHGFRRLQTPFLRRYFRENPGAASAADEPIFAYYRWYRANVRLKISVLCDQAALPGGGGDQVERYWRLYRKYGAELEQAHKAAARNRRWETIISS
jgi:aminoglycoside phosphotransferase family enzyme